MIRVGQIVSIESASAILGDVVSVDEVNGVAVVVWRTQQTTELLEDLTVVDEAAK